MQKPQQILALEARIDYLISKIDAQADIFLQSHLGRYLLILTAGYFEQAVQSALTQFTQARAQPQIVNYISTSLGWEGSINRDKLGRILDRFDRAWFIQLESATTDAEKNALDSVKELRDQLAHGVDNGTGYGVIKSYHQLVRSYVGHLLTVLP